jgi:TonB family protein
MARLKTRSVSTDRHRRVHIQTVAGQNLEAPIATEYPSEEPLRLDEELPAISLVAELPPVENVAPKPISDLALDLVLNEIVLQARLTTNATGAVIALEQSHKLICRATTGATSSEIAAFLNIPSGVSTTCFETGSVKRMDNIEVAPDSHADAAAYQRAGVRSILVVPISNDEDQVLGVLQSFSPRPNAFCDRDVLTLQALARRIATNIELVKKSCSVDATKVPLPLAKSSDVNTPRHDPRPSPFQFRAPHFFSHLHAKRWKVMPANLAATFGRTALVLVLLAACVTAGKFWIRSRGMAQPAVVHRSSQLPVQRTAPPPASAVALNIPRPEVNSADAKLTISTLAPSRQRVPKAQLRSPKHHATSITIERKPVRNSMTSTVGDRKAADKTPPSSGEIVLFEDQQSSTQKPTVKSVSDAVSSNPANSSVETISTQAALARLVQRVEPEYPNMARHQHIQGDVLLDILVNESGTVVELALVSGAPQLMPAAEQAVRQWHFQPLTKSGHAQKFKSRVGINFTLATEGSSQSR